MPSLLKSLDLVELCENQKPSTLTTIKGFHCRIEFHRNKWIILWPQEWWDKLNNESHRQQFLNRH